MDYHVSPELLEKSAKCNQDFACQKPFWKPCGTVKKTINDRMFELGVNLQNLWPCHYGVAFGDGLYCTCPTRLEIFKQYGV
jgi:hypothetical protein